MRIDTSGTRRVRHEVADGVALMVFSLATSVVVALLTAALLGAS